MKNIILIAPPAAGKGTQAEMIVNKYNVPSISTGNLLRAARNNETEIGRSIIEAQDKGLLVSDDIVIELLRNRLSESDCDNGYILDGFPRTIAQAKAYQTMLNELGKELGDVIYLEIDKEIAKERIVGRISCPNCGTTYNEYIVDTMPKVKGICDKCNGPLTKRSDDNEEAFNVRFDTYIEKTAPLIDYYEAQGVLFRVNSGISKDYTNIEVEKIINRD